jgi:hypothetical protein
MGFEMEFDGSASSTDVPGRPLRGYVSFGAYGYFEEQVRVKATGELRTRAAVGDETDGAHFEINGPPEPFGWDDAQGRMFLGPVQAYKDVQARRPHSTPPAARPSLVC